MANLLPRHRAPFPALTEAQRARVERRARSIVGRWDVLRLDGADLAERLAPELDDLDEAPALASAQAILADIEFWRDERRSDDDRIGEPAWLLYRPGRSLRSGEAEVASRGFFDVADRPPPSVWVEALARPRAVGSSESEVGILCAIPAAVRGAAEAGVDACPSGALAWLGGVDGPLEESRGER